MDGGQPGAAESPETPLRKPTRMRKRTQAMKVLRNPTTHIMIAVLLGAALGFGLRSAGAAQEDVVRVVGFPGKLWLKGLKCIVLPMVVFAMVQAMTMMRSLPGAKAVGAIVVGLYALTTLLAAGVGCLTAAFVLSPLVGDFDTGAEASASPAPDLEELSLLDSVLNIFDGLVPSNLIDDAGKNQFLPIIVASIVFGLLIEDKEADGSMSATLKVVSQMNAVVGKVITFLMKLAPMGVGCLVFSSAAKMDLESTGRLLGMFILSCYIGFGVHALVMYQLIILLFARRNPIRYLCNIAPAVLTALGTSSSVATLPENTRCAIENNGLRPPVAKFVLSLGATINMDGTGLFLINAVYFLGRIEDVKFTVGRFLLMAVLAMLCSLGSAPVPSAGMVLLATMMTSSGVPMTDSFGLVVGIVWIVDRGMTMVNITGDSAVAAVVDRILGSQGGFEEADAEKAAPAADELTLEGVVLPDRSTNPMGGANFYAPPDPESADEDGPDSSDESLTDD